MIHMLRFYIFLTIIAQLFLLNYEVCIVFLMWTIVAISISFYFMLYKPMVYSLFKNYLKQFLFCVAFSLPYFMYSILCTTFKLNNYLYASTQ